MNKNKEKRSTKAVEAAYSEFCELRDIHRSIALAHANGIDTEGFAEARGVHDVAKNSVYAAIDAAQEIYEQFPEAKDRARKAARDAALKVIYDARKKELLFLRDGTQSATVILAYLLARNLWHLA